MVLECSRSRLHGVRGFGHVFLLEQLSAGVCKCCVAFSKENSSVCGFLGQRRQEPQVSGVSPSGSL